MGNWYLSFPIGLHSLSASTVDRKLSTVKPTSVRWEEEEVVVATIPPAKQHSVTVPLEDEVVPSK